MGAGLTWNNSFLVIESEAVRRRAVGCIAWLDHSRCLAPSATTMKLTASVSDEPSRIEARRLV